MKINLLQRFKESWNKPVETQLDFQLSNTDNEKVKEFCECDSVLLTLMDVGSRVKATFEKKQAEDVVIWKTEVGIARPGSDPWFSVSQKFNNNAEERLIFIEINTSDADLIIK